MAELPKVIGVIPARGGSKRLPRKNIRLLCGKPLIHYTIEAALAAQSCVDWVLSTEDPEIKDYGSGFNNLELIDRPTYLASDDVTNDEVVLHALELMENKNKEQYDIAILLQPTSPIRASSHIDLAIELLWSGTLPTLVSVKGPVTKRRFVIKRLDGLNRLTNYCSNMPQDKEPEPFFLYNASIYAAKRNYLVTHRAMVSDQQIPLFMDSVYSIDVDHEIDLKIAEMVIQSKMESN